MRHQCIIGTQTHGICQKAPPETSLLLVMSLIGFDCMTGIPDRGTTTRCWRATALSVLCIGMGAFPANAKGMDVNTLIRSYDIAPAAREEMELTAGSIQYGFLLSNSYIIRYRHEEPMYCQPGNLTLTGAMVIDMLRHAAQADPTIGTADFGLGILLTLAKTFPCTKSK